MAQNKKMFLHPNTFESTHLFTQNKLNIKNLKSHQSKQGHNKLSLPNVKEVIQRKT